MTKTRVTLFLGGTSSERDVSLASGARIMVALRERGYEVRPVDPASGPLSKEAEAALLSGQIVKTAPPSRTDLERMARESLPRLVQNIPRPGEADVVFLGLHGGYGEDGTIQALMDVVGVPYTGSGHLASAIALDKEVSKHLFRDAKVPTAEWLVVSKQSWRSNRAAQPLDRWVERLGLPLIVKPPREGSTVGLTVVKDSRQLPAAIDEALQFDDAALLEAFIPGRELTVSILGGEALPVGEIIPKHEIYDYECKYTPGMAVEEFPAKLSKAETERIQQLAQRAFDALKLRGCARIDFRMSSEDGEFYCLEANTLPGMTGTSLVPQAAAVAGINFPDLCDRITRLALEPGRVGR
ncbi:MAG TPA: D-alanine--D-alanine ligase [Gemmatimonadaceae bacterium]